MKIAIYAGEIPATTFIERLVKGLASANLEIGLFGSITKPFSPISGVQAIGINSRLDEIQAAFLNIKLPMLDEDNDKRRSIARRYLSEMNNEKIKLPFYNHAQDHVFHQFVVRVEDRNHFLDYLKNQDVETLIHYPIPPHQQEALVEFSNLNFPITEKIHQEVLSIPISPVLNNIEVQKIIEVLNSF